MVISMLLISLLCIIFIFELRGARMFSVCNGISNIQMFISKKYLKNYESDLILITIPFN